MRGKTILTKLLLYIFWKLRSICLLAVLSSPLIVFGQGEETLVPMQQIDPYFIKAWTTDQGLPQNSVNKIIQTKDGYLWMATFGGLVRFDGITFDIFDIGNSPNLGSNRLIFLFEDHEGVLWIVHEGSGVSLYKDGVFSQFGKGTPYQDTDVVEILEDEKNQIWLGTKDGLLKYAEGHFTLFTTENGLVDNHVKKMLLSSDGSLTILTGTIGYTKAGISVVHNDQIINISQNPLEDGLNTIYYDEDSTLWIAFEEKLIRHQGNDFRNVLTYRNNLFNGINQIIKDQQRNVWVGTRDGLIVFNETDLEKSLKDEIKYDPYIFEELRNVTIISIFQDRQQNIWVGTDGNGLIFLKRRQITRYIIPEDFSSKSFNALAPDGTGGLWLGTQCGNLFHYQNGVFIINPEIQGCVGALLLDSKERLWVGQNFLLNYVNDGKYTHVTNLGDSTFDSKISALFQDKDGVLWLGTIGNGLYTFKDQMDARPKERKGFSGHHILVINQTSDGVIWIGTYQGLSKLENGRITSITTEEGLAPGAIRSIYEDDQGILWIGSYGGGLSRIKDGKITRYTKEDGLFDNVVSRITEDDKGNLWMLGNLGLYFVSRKDLNDFAEGKIRYLLCISFDSNDGMAEGNGAGNVFTTSDGLTWWPTINGIAGININSFIVDSIAPKVVIKGLRISNQIVPYNGNDIILNEGQRDIEIEYAGISFSSPEKVHFKYRLDGYDDDWISGGSRRVSTYTNLPPGEYTFQVKAQNEYHIWDETDATLRITVKPTFWQTTEAKALLIVVIAIILYGILRWRTGYLRTRKKILEKEVQERTVALKTTNEKLKLSNETVSVKKEELEKTLQELKQAQKYLVQSEKMASLGILAAGIGHEINNPLNFIKGGIYGLQDKIKQNLDLDKNGIEPYFKIINEGVDRASKIVKGLSHFSRGGSDMTEVCDLHSIIDNCLIILQIKMKGRVEVKKYYTKKKAVCKGNEGKMHQALMNILTNAEQAIEESGEITIKTEVHNREIEIKISDSGVGISDNDLQKIWDPFFTTKEPGMGIGLGLSITFAIVEEHNGTINVSSREGLGTEFIIRFPI